MGGRIELEEEEEDEADEPPSHSTGAAGISSSLLDRSKVRILLCDNDPSSSAQILQILLSCSYRVISVSTARQVVSTLESHAADIDIILMEVDLPVSKGFKLLKHIVKKKDMHRIPIITMSTKDEVSVVVQCLRLGAADYLVKPLRMNELLHLWTHMWRRRRMLGLAEKDVLHCDPDHVASDPSDGNTNSPTLLSDDSGDMPKKNATLESSLPTQEVLDSKSLVVEDAVDTPVGNHCTVSEDKELEVPPGIFSCPKKYELKIGESSAFFTYTKSRISKVDTGEGNHMDRNNSSEHTGCWKGNTPAGAAEPASSSNCGWEQYGSRDNHNGSIDGSVSKNFRAPPAVAEEMKSHLSVPKPSNEGHFAFSGLPSAYHLPFFFSGALGQTAVPPSEETYRGNLPTQQPPQGNPIILPPYAAIPGCHLPAVASLPYHPVATELPVRNMAVQGIWPPVASPLKPDPKSGHRMERREAALMKFRQKRKDRCFDKKIRYVNRKRLAEKRPRIRGQFVRRSNGVDVDLNGHPTISDTDDEDDDDDVYVEENEEDGE